MLEGNCIDKFISKKINLLLIRILTLRSSIKNRINERKENNNYFNIACYEQDFSDIRKIRDEAQLLVDNCNRFLERISEQYSKLN